MSAQRELDLLVERVLEQVRAQAAAGGLGAVEATARAETGVLALTRFAASAVHQNTEDVRTTVRVTVALPGGRTATAATTRTSGPALEALVASALAAARVRAADPLWAGVTGPAPVAPGAGPDEATASATPDQRADLVAAFVAAAGGLETAGYAQTTSLTTALADTAGQHARGATTSATVDGIARARQAPSAAGAGPDDGSFRADGVGRATARRLADLDPAALGARAAARARAQTAPAQPLARGAWPVVLEPNAVVDVVAGLLSTTLTGRGVLEGTSGVRLGEQQLDAALTLVDDPLDAASTALPFDVEGTPAARTELVRAGVPVAVTTDRRTATALRERLGSDAPQASAGATDASETAGPSATAPSLAAGSGGSVDDLVAGLEHGLLVCDLWYTRVAEAKRSVWTGLTRNGTFLVRDGQVVGPVGVLRFTQSYLEALAPGAVVVGSGVEALPRALAFGAAGTARVAVPALRLAGWNVTGGAAT